MKGESEKTDLWQPKWDEDQTVFATAIHTLDRDAGPLEGAAPGSLQGLRVVEQAQGEGCWELGFRGCGTIQGEDSCELEFKGCGAIPG